MKMTIQRAKLVEGLRLLSPMRALRDIEHYAVIKAKDGKATLHGVDVASHVDIVLGDCHDEGEAAIPKQRVLRLVENDAADEVTIVCGDGKVDIQLACGKATVMSIPCSHFPEKPERLPENVVVLGEDLAYALGCTAFATDKSAVRYAGMSGVQFSIFEGKLRLAATDGRRLSYVERPISIKATPEHKSFVLPPQCVGPITKLFGHSDAAIAFGENAAMFSSEDATVWVHPLEGRFPNVDKILTHDPRESVARMQRELFTALLRQASVITNERVELTFDGGMLTVANKGEAGEAALRIPCEMFDGKAKFVFNPQFMTEYLSHARGEYIDMIFTDSNDKVLFEDGSFAHAIMPLVAD